MSYVVKYRAGFGRGAPTRRVTLGRVGTLTPDEARALARKTLGAVASGADPAAAKALDREAATVRELGERFLKSTPQEEAGDRRQDPGRIGPLFPWKADLRISCGASFRRGA
jgi:hypothetical protein